VSKDGFAVSFYSRRNPYIGKMDEQYFYSIKFCYLRPCYTHLAIYKFRTELYLYRLNNKTNTEHLINDPKQINTHTLFLYVQFCYFIDSGSTFWPSCKIPRPVQCTSHAQPQLPHMLVIAQNRFDWWKDVVKSNDFFRHEVNQQRDLSVDHRVEKSIVILFITAAFYYNTYRVSVRLQTVQESDHS